MAPVTSATLGQPKRPETKSYIDFEQVRLLKAKLEQEKERHGVREVASKENAEHRGRRDDVKEPLTEKEQSEYYSVPPGVADCGPEGRFLIQEELGRGQFSSVYRCEDTESSGMSYAIKFTRANAQCRRATERELKLLGELCAKTGQSDPEAARFILWSVFFEGIEHEGHLAVVFELMRCDLRVALKRYGQGRGLPLLPTIRNFGKQLFLALRALRRVGVIHCDVKPDNLLMSLDKLTVKLCDFGSAVGVHQRVRTDYLQPRHYRAPEISLGQTYGMEIDIWSAGATLSELATGQTLFRGCSNNAMLHEILKVCGPFPKSFATEGVFRKKHFKDNGDFLNTEGGFGVDAKDPPIIAMGRFRGPLRPLSKLLAPEAMKEAPEDAAASFAELLGQCLRVLPSERCEPRHAARHAFFSFSSGLA